MDIVRLLEHVEYLENMTNVFVGTTRVGRDARYLQLSLLAEAAKLVRSDLPARQRKVETVDGLTPDEAKLLRTPSSYNAHGDKIGTIKAVRARTGLDLHGAKNLVEDYMENHFGYRHFPNG